MALILSTTAPADVGYPSDWSLTDEATPSSPEKGGSSVDAGSFSTGAVDGDQFLDGRAVNVETPARRKNMLVLNRDSNLVSTNFNTTGTLGRFVTGDIEVPPMQDGAVGAALDYMLQKTGEKRVSQFYPQGGSHNMFYSSLKGHSATFRVSNNQEYIPDDGTSLKVTGNPWRLETDNGQGYHAFRTSEVVDTTGKVVGIAPWNYSATWLFGNINLNDSYRHVYKVIARKHENSGYLDFSGYMSRNQRKGTNIPVEISVSFGTRKLQVSVNKELSPTSRVDIDEDIDINNSEFVLTVDFRYLGGRIDIGVRVANLDNTASSSARINTVPATEDGRIGTMNSSPVGFIGGLFRSAVYDRILPSWTEWEHLYELPTILTLESGEGLGHEVRRFSGTGWDYLNEVLSTHGYEMRARTGDQIVVEPNASRRIEIENFSNESFSATRPEISSYMLEFSEPVNIYPREHVRMLTQTEGDTVELGETVYTTLETQGEFVYAYNPIVYGSLVSTHSSYNVYDSEDNLVSSKAWVESGGSVRVKMSNDGRGVDVITKGPIFDIPGSLAPFTIRNLTLSGDGQRTYQTSVRVYTGVPEPMGTTSIPSISYCTSITRNAAAAIAQRVSTGITNSVTFSFETDYVSPDFNNVVGCIFRYKGLDYRVTSHEETQAFTSMTAEPYTTFDALMRQWSGKTLGQLQNEWKGYTFSDLSRTILETN